jgi:hypothetical protein
MVWGLILVGCGGGAIDRMPSDTLRAYASAIEEGRTDEAYALLSRDARRQVPIEAFRRSIAAGRDEALELARAIERPAVPAAITASLALPNGDRLDLVLEDGQWRVTAAAVDWYSQATPRRAAETFLRALEKKRWDVLIRLVPDVEREGVPVGSEDERAAPALTPEKLKEAWEGPQAQEMALVAKALRAALPTAVIEEQGDVASLAYGPGATVSFVRENGLWKIRDF